MKDEALDGLLESANEAIRNLHQALELVELLARMMEERTNENQKRKP